MPPRRHFSLIDLTGVFTVAAVAVISFISIDDVAARWTSLTLMLAFAGL
ncbi:MAG: hypothetical protein JNK29_05950, partial [Anaerolineales bacterium]|nr:hypothetical protein [Anaerolineales bacterium]